MRAISRLAKMRSLCTTPYHSKPSSSSRPGSRLSTSPLTNLDDKDFSSRSKSVIATAIPPRLRTTRLAAATTTANNSGTLGSSGTAAASKSRSTAQRRREPLQRRDQNAAPTTRTMRLAHNPKTQPSTATPTNTNLKMPFERASGLSGKGQQQQQQQSPLPTLARGVNKPPLTPKIAARSSTPQQYPSVTVATPLPRRAQRPESSLGSLAGGPAREKDREDVASPITTFLNNITPRSGSRQSRVDSTNTTPNGTPQPDRFDGFESKSSLGAAAPKMDESRPSVTFSTVEVPGGPKQSVESKFFYASDAPKPVSSPSQPTRPYVSQPQKQSTFFYANGANVSERSNTAAAAPAQFTPAGATLNLQDNLMSKFVYADGSSNAQPTTRPSSIVSTSSKVMTGRPGLGVQNAAYAGPRPASPIKLAPFPLVTATATNPSVVTRQPVLPPPAGPTGPEARRTSGPETKPRLTGGGHSRGGSLTMAEPPAVARLMSAHSSQQPSESSSPSNVSSPGFTLFTGGPAASGFASLLQAADDFVEEEEEEEEEEDAVGDEAEEKSAPSDSPKSPTKSSSMENPLDELIANARRERKVQDLQITNASLEAINRTLERQLRKQTAELRRYRRLSRSGRISLNSLGGRDRISSNSTVDGGGLARAGMGLDDLSEEESEIEAEEEEEEDLYSDSDSGSGDLSPGALALRDARHRFKDEERLQLDLSKHQQLLVDSQKMNQSLKRCLGWTEELIKEGKRALEYQVRVSEVTLGGRVLAPEDIEDQDEGSEAAGDDTIPGAKFELEHSIETGDKLDWGESLPDRDSGIELPADGG